jgi:hypothetical protein
MPDPTSISSEIPRWVRVCQECGHIQSAIQPSPEKELSDSYRNSKCRKCKSESLDYGKLKYSAEIIKHEIENED